ncbi:MAG: Mu transposase domain-containing protein [bacterium]
MRELDVAKLPEYVEEEVRVSEWSTVRVKHCAYSVPSRLMGKWVRVRIFEDRLEVRFADEVQLACERLIGRNLRRIDYRHVIWSLIRKPGAFARYVYREEMFPSPVFRLAHDAIHARRPGTQGDLEYLRILHLAASTMEADVAVALSLLQMAGTTITAAAVKEMIAAAPTSIDVPQLVPSVVILAAYDALLPEVAA